MKVNEQKKKCNKSHEKNPPLSSYHRDQDSQAARTSPSPSPSPIEQFNIREVVIF